MHPKVNELIDAVEQAILDLAQRSIEVPSDQRGSKAVPIQPLYVWGDQSYVLDFKAFLRVRFDKALNGTK